MDKDGTGDTQSSINSRDTMSLINNNNFNWSTEKGDTYGIPKFRRFNR